MEMDHEFGAGRSFDLFGDADAQPFAGFEPERPRRLAHRLAGHPLLDCEMLARVSPRLDPAHVQIRMPSNRHGAGFPFYEGELAIDKAIRDIAEIGCWVVLGKLETLPEYRELFDGALAAIRRELEPAFGPLIAIESFLFISRPGTLTPFHFDPEYNILFQIAGRKDFAIFPADKRFVPDSINEKYHQDGDNLLPWDDGRAGEGIVHALAPGEALYVPYKVPHWVAVGDEPSISLSVTWRTAASLEQDNAWHMNAWLRRKGIVPRPPQPLPARHRTKSFAFRSLRRVGLA